MVVDGPHGANRTVRPDPPRDLGAAEATEWREMVASMPADYFASYPLQITLRMWCGSVVEARYIDRLIADCCKQKKPTREYLKLVNMQLEGTQMLLKLQRAMRLTHQQTIRSDSARLRPSPSPVYRPWDMKKQ
jgi:hypothetical protein